MGVETAVAMAGLGLIGGLQKDTSTQEEVSGIRLDDAGALEKRASSTLMSQLAEMRGMAGDTGQALFAESNLESQALAQRYRDMAAGGGLPSGAQLGAAQGISEQLFAPQAEALRQQFQTQAMDAQRTAAIMGRSGTDPILQAKLAQSQARESSLLGARQGAEAQRMALQMPGQEMSMRGQAASITQGLAQNQYGRSQQAMKNRMSLAQIGSQILGQQQQFRYQTGERYGTGTTESGGGLGGAMQGALSGFGAGASVYNMMGQGDYFKKLTDQLGQPQGPPQQSGVNDQQWLADYSGRLQSALNPAQGQYSPPVNQISATQQAHNQVNRQNQMNQASYFPPTTPINPRLYAQNMGGRWY